MDSSNTVTFEQRVAEYVAELNAGADRLKDAGAGPLYARFGASIGPKHARIFSIDGAGSRSARAFFGRDGNLRRADSWKKPGRVLGKADQCMGYVLAAYMSSAALAAKYIRVMGIHYRIEATYRTQEAANCHLIAHPEHAVIAVIGSEVVIVSASDLGVEKAPLGSVVRIAD